MNIIYTGISKCNKLGYLKEVKEYSKKLHDKGKVKNKDIQIHSVGHVMLNCLKNHTTVNEHILNKDDEQLGQAAETAIKTIKIKLQEEKLKGKQDNHNIISTHTTFIWKHHWMDSHNEDFLHILEPDLFVTILEHEKRIQERQHNNPQWKLQNLSLEAIALWQDREVRETEKWAKRFGKRHIVFGRNQDPETLYKILNYPKAPIFYSNFPMTYLKNAQESYAKITANNQEMQKYGSVIDPRTIEIMKPGEGGDYSYTPLEKEILKIIENKKQECLEKGIELTDLEKKVDSYLTNRKVSEEKIIKCLTVHRDLDYYVAKADVDVLYFPELVLSFGGVSEVIKAHRCSKETYLIFPEGFKKKSIGPFEVYHSLKIFFGTDEFHEFLSKKFKKLGIN